MKLIHSIINLLRHNGLMHRQRVEGAGHPMILDGHERIRLRLLLNAPFIMGVQKHSDVVIMIQRNDDHLAIFGVDSVELRVGPILVSEHCVGGAEAAPFACRSIPDDQKPNRG